MIKGKKRFFTQEEPTIKKIVFFPFQVGGVSARSFSPSRQWELVALEDPHESEVPVEEFQQRHKALSAKS